MGTLRRPQMRPGGAANSSRSDPPPLPPRGPPRAAVGRRGKGKEVGGGTAGSAAMGGSCGAGTVRVTLVGLALWDGAVGLALEG